MTQATFIIRSRQDREQIFRFVQNAPDLTAVTFKRNRRSVDQNSLMWRQLTLIAGQLDWHGQKYTADDWKDFGMHALRRARWMPGEDGGMVPVGMRTSDLTRDEMGELVEFLYAFGAQHGVDFGEDQRVAA